MSKKKQPTTTASLMPDDERIAELKQQLATMTDALQRERADAVNLRRRYEEQIEALHKNSKIRLLRDLLPLLDNIEISLKHVPAELETHEYINGVRAIAKQFDHILTQLGVQRIETVGKEFNPDLHEAVSMDDGDGDREIISEEMRPGFRLDSGDVLRHAMVKVKREMLQN